MRRLGLILTLGLIASIGGGCIGVSATEHRQIVADDRDVVVLDGQLYVVEKSSGRVMTLDVSKAEPFVKASAVCQDEQ